MLFYRGTGEVTVRSQDGSRFCLNPGSQSVSSGPEGRHRNAGGNRRAFLFIEPRGLAAPAGIMPPLRGWCFG
jgi:hypothetical protein